MQESMFLYIFNLFTKVCIKFMNKVTIKYMIKSMFFFYFECVFFHCLNFINKVSFEYCKKVCFCIYLIYLLKCVKIYE